MDAYEKGALPCNYWTVKHDRAELTDGGVIEEALLTIYVNAQELATIMCSPIEQEALALGFLHNEGVIRSIDEVRLIQANVARTVVDIFLNRSNFNTPRRITLPSGCGGGISFQDLAAAQPALDTEFSVTPRVIFDRMRDLKGAARLYNRVRGVHTSVLADKDHLLVIAEDIGRHNTLDKLAGKALQQGTETRDRILLTTGRISSEMLNKARQMKVPLVASHTSPTSLSVRLAHALNICVVGYVRRGSMRVYTHPYRLGLLEVTKRASGERHREWPGYDNAP